MYALLVPKLWSETIDAHRREVRTLYKYFPDVEAILVAHHLQHVAGHLAQLAELRHTPGTPSQRLEAVCEAYALISYHRAQHGGDTELHALLHRDQHVAGVRQQLFDFFRDLLTEAARVGEIRTDVSPIELARYCVHALDAAGDLPSRAAVSRLVPVVLSALRPVRNSRTETLD